MYQYLATEKATTSFYSSLIDMTHYKLCNFYSLLQKLSGDTQRRYSLQEARVEKFFLVYIYMETYMHVCLAQDTFKLLPDVTFILKAHTCFTQRSSQLRCYYLYF